MYNIAEYKQKTYTHISDDKDRERKKETSEHWTANTLWPWIKNKTNDMDKLVFLPSKPFPC